MGPSQSEDRDAPSEPWSGERSDMEEEHEGEDTEADDDALTVLALRTELHEAHEMRLRRMDTELQLSPVSLDALERPPRRRS